MATYVNNLRLKEIATGDESGTWGTSTNTNLELIGEALGFGTEAITTNADTHATTVADGSADAGRAMYLKYTGTLDSACTITIGPNTMKRMQFIENGTSGSQNIIISQGSGANITIPPGDVKAVYLDGAGSGAAVVDAFASLSVVDLKVQDDLTVTDDASIGGDATITGTLGVSGLITANANLTLAGTTPTLTIGDAGAEDTKIVFDGNAQDFYIALDDSADDLIVGLGSTVGTTPIISLTEAGAVTLKNVGTGDDNPMSLTLQTSETDIAADDVLGKISFQAPDEGTGTDAILVAAAMQAISEGDFSASSNATSLAFMTGASEAATTKMTVTSGGHVGIGMTPAPVGSDTVLSIYNSATPRIKLHNSTTGSASGDGAEINMSSSDLIIENREAGNQRFFTNGSERLRVDSSGNIGVGTTSASSKLQIMGGTSGVDQISLSSNLSDNTDKYAGLVMTMYTNNTAALIGAKAENGNTSLFYGSSGTDHRGVTKHIWYTNSNYNSTSGNTARMTIDSNGVMGFGTSPSGTNAGTAIFEGNVSSKDGFMTTATDLQFIAPSGGSSNTIFVRDNGNESARIDSDGSLLVGTTSKASDCSITAPASPTVPAFLTQNTTTGATHYAAFFRNSGGTEIGFIKISNTGTTYDTGSDYRLKENAQPIQNGLERLNQLNPVKFDWKADGTSSEGFIAHEVQEIFPDAVSGEKDAETMQGMDYGRITPLLVKAIQEQQTQIDALQSEINTLKGE